ncbi:MAG: hypothetical protein ACYC6M_04620 [Terriglobales bacterium]
MKRWIVPAAAVGVTVFLMTDRGRKVQKKVIAQLDGWLNRLQNVSETLQDRLEKVHGAVENVPRALQRIA